MNVRKILLWLGWILANTAGIVVSHLVTVAVFLLAFAVLAFAVLAEASPGSPGVFLFTTLVVPGVAGGIAGSVVSGILQWSVLRHYTSRAAWWVSIGAAGFAVGYAVTVVLAYLVFFLSIMLSSFPGPYRFHGPYIMSAFNQGAAAGCVLGALVGTVGGTVSGIGQWLVLRRHVSRSGWWVPASTVKLIIELIASGIGAPAAFVIAEVLGSTVPSAALPDPGIPIVIGCLSIVAGGLLSGAITGGVLAWLLQAPAETPAPEEDTTSPPQDELPR